MLPYLSACEIFFQDTQRATNLSKQLKLRTNRFFYRISMFRIFGVIIRNSCKLSCDNEIFNEGIQETGTRQDELNEKR